VVFRVGRGPNLPGVMQVIRCRIFFPLDRPAESLRVANFIGDLPRQIGIFRSITQQKGRGMFKALVIDSTGGTASTSIQNLDEARLPAGNVTVAVEYSTLNYKDGLVVTGAGGLVKQYPHVPGVDFAGTVTQSGDPTFKPGDKVILTGWRVGEVRWGGLSQKAAANAEWLVPLPSGLTTLQAMAIGTAGFTAMLAVIALEAHGLNPKSGEVLVTGAAGGVGSVATAILAKRGYQVVASTGRPETHEYLRGLGATTIIDRSGFADPAKRPLEGERWAACVDSVGGNTLARVLAQTKYGGSAAAVGLAGGSKLDHTVIPFLLRGVNLLGIDSVMCPMPRRIEAWHRLQSDLPLDLLEAMTIKARLDEVPRLAAEILKGHVCGRVVVDVNG
jgi:acrylyl-CoA reductase (NADPH)